MVLNMRMKDEISPTLRNIVNRFDEDNRRPSDFQPSSYESADDAVFNNEVGFDGDEIDNSGNWSDDHGDETTVVDEGPNFADSTYPDYHEVLLWTMHGIDFASKTVLFVLLKIFNYIRNIRGNCSMIYGLTFAGN